MDIVSDLFSLIAVNFVFCAFNVAFDEVAEKAMELDTRMLRSG